MYKPLVHILGVFSLAGWLAGCQPQASVAEIGGAEATAVNHPQVTQSNPKATAVLAGTFLKPDRQPETLTPIPTATPSPAPTATSTPTKAPSPTPIGPCDQRIPGSDLLPIITLDYGVSQNYIPPDLVNLGDFLPVTVTFGYPTQVRKTIIGPLVEMVKAMQSAGLEPTIISGYRSFSTQAVAWDKWHTQFPDRADILSAPPGHSEHQLGTTIDFGTPELADITGEPDLQFHTSFYQTRVGLWLQENAHRFGFTLSYPREAFDLTGFYYEPWHYRYIGNPLATRLHNDETYLTAYLLDTQTPPCIP